MKDDWVIYLDLGDSEGMEPPMFGVDGMGVDLAPDPELAIKMALTGRYKAIVLNAGAESGKALFFLSRLRERSRIPVLILISKSAVEALPDLYAAGADGHLWSPAPHVLLDAKLLAILRRSYLLSSAGSLRAHPSAA